jgi:hypothetical protein
MSRTTPHSPDIPSQLALLLHIGLFRCRYLSHAFSRSVSIVDVPAVSHTHRYDITDHPRPTMSLKSSTSNSSPRQGWPLHHTFLCSWSHHTVITHVLVSPTVIQRTRDTYGFLLCEYFQIEKNIPRYYNRRSTTPLYLFTVARATYAWVVWSHMLTHEKRKKTSILLATSGFKSNA